MEKFNREAQYQKCFQQHKTLAFVPQHATVTTLRGDKVSMYVNPYKHLRGFKWHMQSLG